jgi:uncharacterized protein YqfA (UPF0365 family)
VVGLLAAAPAGAEELEVNISADTAFILGVVATIVALLLAWVLLRLAGPWMLAQGSGIRLSLSELVGMRMRRSDASLIVATAATLHKLGESVSIPELEAAYLSLPHNQRSLTELMRSVRPQLVTRLEAEAKSRASRSYS